MRVWYSAFRYCPDPLGIVTAKQLGKSEFGGESPLTMRAWCSAFRYCPDPLGIVTAEVLDKFEFKLLVWRSQPPTIAVIASQSADWRGNLLCRTYILS